MQLYIVNFELNSGHTLPVLITAPTVHIAIDQAAAMVRASAEPRNAGDVMQYNWRLEETTAEVFNGGLKFDYQGNLIA